MKRNYDKEMQALLDVIPQGEELLLHSCCGPCSSAVLEQLAEHFAITLLYYNPNIWPQKEYDRRQDEQESLLQKLCTTYPIKFIRVEYNPEEFLQVALGLEEEPEGGARCAQCFKLRLTQAAKEAKSRGIKWFTTTLSISPHKNSMLLNKIGEEIAAEYELNYLFSDFKKREGYKRSLDLSSQYGLYRQEYCGCEFSYRQRQAEQ